MTGKQAEKLTGLTRHQLLKHQCPWCGQSIWRAVVYGCGAIWEKCDPVQRAAVLNLAAARKGKR